MITEVFYAKPPEALETTPDGITWNAGSESNDPKATYQMLEEFSKLNNSYTHFTRIPSTMDGFMAIRLGK